VKSQAASQAIDELYQKIEIWREQGRRKADVAKLSAKAINIQAKRDKIRNEKARQAVEENIKSILLSSAGKEITYADMIRIWQECLIEGIMTQ
jgi:hypothetical protein